MESIAVDSGTDDDSPLEFESLLAAGLDGIRQLAGNTWTDHNAHDPGITILEQVCYALTDLDYRIHHGIPDLLAEGGRDPHAGLPAPSQVLPTQPVTLEDLRLTVLDVPGVKNVWIELMDAPLALADTVTKEISAAGRPDGGGMSRPGSPNVQGVSVRGLYRVIIEKSDLADIDGGTIKRDAARRLHAARGLCQDFVDIDVLPHQDMAIGASLEMDATQDAESLLAAVYASLAEYLSPSIRFRRLDEMLALGRSPDEIFDGPLLEHGYIDRPDLARLSRRTTLRISDLIRICMEVPGILAVKDIHFLDGAGTPIRDWVLDVAQDRTPRFDPQASRIHLERAGLRVTEEIRAGALRLFEGKAKNASDSSRLDPQQRDLQTAGGRQRHVARYHSIQHQFPATYGLGTGGLPDSAPWSRKAMVQQLKAYLLFYDQILANQFAQLAHLSTLFSLEDESDIAYFSQPVPDDGLLGLDAVNLLPVDEHQTELRRLAESPWGENPADGQRRRNRFLDHLLARHGEQLHGYALLQSDILDPEDTSREVRLGQDKRAFLRELPRIGRDRGTAFNYLEPEGEDNISGLERLLRRKLGVSRPEERFYIVEHVLLRPGPGDAQQQAPLMRAVRDADPYSLQLTFVFPLAGRFSRANFKQYVENTVREHTPVHLTPHVLWKDVSAMHDFLEAYHAWMGRLRAHASARLGL